MYNNNNDINHDNSYIVYNNVKCSWARGHHKVSSHNRSYYSLYVPDESPSKLVQGFIKSADVYVNIGPSPFPTFLTSYLFSFYLSHFVWTKVFFIDT